MGRPKAKRPRDKIIKFRVNEKEINRIKGLAKIYASGDLSVWLRHGALNAERRFLK